MRSTLIRRATLLTMDGVHDTTPFQGDLLIRDGKIAAIGPDLGDIAGADIIDGRDRLVMPGLINAHLHSGETFFKGRYHGLPLELWLLYAYPFWGPVVSPRLLYLRSVLVAMESLRNGVTTICDDFFDPPSHNLDRLSQVFAAYDDVGIRANISSAVMNIAPLDAVPYAREIMPATVQAKLDFGPPLSADAYMDYCAAAFASLDGRAGRLRFMLAPSAPQRCTPELLMACDKLARRHGVPLHSHVLETKVQAVTGREFHGKSLIAYLGDLGLLHRGLTIAHGVWLDDDDIALLGAAGCSVVHNCLSNQKLGSGLAPIRKLIDAGVTVALGTDGVSSNDTPRLFDVMRAAALIHNMGGPDTASWLKPDEILRAATINGARSALLDHVTGSLAIGKSADLLILRTDSYNFMPLNDIRHQLVYCENGSSIDQVFVQGEAVYRDGRLTCIDEAAILAEIRDLLPPYLAEQAAAEKTGADLHPYFAEIHSRAGNQDLGFTRYTG